MSKYIVIADRRTAYAELAVRATDKNSRANNWCGCLLRIRPPVDYELPSPLSRGIIQWGKPTTALTDYVALPHDVFDVWGNPNKRAVELIHSLLCGYGVKLLVIDHIEHLLQNDEARDELERQMPRLYDAAALCKCPMWFVNPNSNEADGFMATVSRVDRQPAQLGTAVVLEQTRREAVMVGGPQ